jgi:hypothetical protein
MEVAKTLSREKIMHSTSLAQVLVTSHDGGNSSGETQESDAAADREASLLLDAAVTLCAIAAKKVHPTPYL